jgi:hypothetical protein
LESGFGFESWVGNFFPSRRSGQQRRHLLARSGPRELVHDVGSACASRCREEIADALPDFDMLRIAVVEIEAMSDWISATKPAKVASCETSLMVSNVALTSEKVTSAFCHSASSSWK